MDAMANALPSADAPEPGAPPEDFGALIRALARAEALPFTLPASEPIEMTQTHASAVLLAGPRAFKLKKPHNFGFFDFSTPVLRRHFCELEVELNARLAPSVYLGVAPVLTDARGRVRFGPTQRVGSVPQPGEVIAGETVVDYAVEMVRLPETATLAVRLQTGTATLALLRQIAHRLAAFHARASADDHVEHFGSPDIIRENWEENFAQLRPYVGRTLDITTYERIAAYVRSLMDRRTQLLASRVRAGRIRDCHGDLRLEHVYALGPDGDPGSQLAIIDCIEFNERFRYGDVASEVAFLVMELDAANRHDLARAFVDGYIAATGDEPLRELLPFYACYRACVRAKVNCFELDEPEVPVEQREAARRQAANLFDLAGRYARGPTRPVLALVGGLMGTGKSTLVSALRQELGWAVVASDAMRKRLAQMDPDEPVAVSFGADIYTSEWTGRTYDAMLAKARAGLDDGRSVLLDASFALREYRQAAQRLAADYAAQGVRVVFVECTCPRPLALDRLAHRWESRAAPAGVRVSADQDVASAASDGRPELYDAQRDTWQPFDQAREPDVDHIVVDTSQPLGRSVSAVLAKVETLG